MIIPTTTMTVNFSTAHVCAIVCNDNKLHLTIAFQRRHLFPCGASLYRTWRIYSIVCDDSKLINRTLAIDVDLSGRTLNYLLYYFYATTVNDSTAHASTIIRGDVKLSAPKIRPLTRYTTCSTTVFVLCSALCAQTGSRRL